MRQRKRTAKPCYWWQNWDGCDGAVANNKRRHRVVARVCVWMGGQHEGNGVQVFVQIRNTYRLLNSYSINFGVNKPRLIDSQQTPIQFLLRKFGAKSILCFEGACPTGKLSSTQPNNPNNSTVESIVHSTYTNLMPAIHFRSYLCTQSQCTRAPGWTYSRHLCTFTKILRHPECERITHIFFLPYGFWLEGRGQVNWVYYNASHLIRASTTIFTASFKYIPKYTQHKLRSMTQSMYRVIFFFYTHRTPPSVTCWAAQPAAMIPPPHHRIVPPKCRPCCRTRTLCSTVCAGTTSIGLVIRHQRLLSRRG